MARVKIVLPDEFSFSCVIPVRITDLNYGGHVGNDTLLGILHEARMQWLLHHGYSEMNFSGTGMIMADAAIEFKSELFYGDSVIARVTATEISRIGFDLVYRLEKKAGDKTELVATAKTGMICYDYKNRKIVSVPEEARKKIQPAG